MVGRRACRLLIGPMPTTCLNQKIRVFLTLLITFQRLAGCERAQEARVPVISTPWSERSREGYTSATCKDFIRSDWSCVGGTRNGKCRQRAERADSSFAQGKTFGFKERRDLEGR